MKNNSKQLPLTPKRLKKIKELAYRMNSVGAIASEFKVDLHRFIRSCLDGDAPQVTRAVLSGERKRFNDEVERYDRAYKVFCEADDKRGSDAVVLWREQRDYFKNFMADYRHGSLDYTLKAWLLKTLEKDKGGNNSFKGFPHIIEDSIAYLNKRQKELAEEALKAKLKAKLKPSQNPAPTGQAVRDGGC